MENEARRDKDIEYKRSKIEKENIELRNKQSIILEKHNTEARKQLDNQKREHQHALKKLEASRTKHQYKEADTTFGSTETKPSLQNELKPTLQKDETKLVSKNGYTCPPRPSEFNGEYICIAAVREKCKMAGGPNCQGSHEFTPEVLQFCFFKTHAMHSYQPLPDAKAKEICARVKALPKK
jgi:hypothetical protein